MTTHVLVIWRFRVWRSEKTLAFFFSLISSHSSLRCRTRIVCFLTSLLGTATSNGLLSLFLKLERVFEARVYRDISRNELQKYLPFTYLHHQSYSIDIGSFILLSFFYYNIISFGFLISTFSLLN